MESNPFQAPIPPLTPVCPTAHTSHPPTIPTLQEKNRHLIQTQLTQIPPIATHPVVLLSAHTTHLDPEVVVVFPLGEICALAVLPRRAAEVAELGATEASRGGQLRQKLSGLGVVGAMC